MMKICRNCQIEKDTSAFYPMAKARAGLTDCICKECAIAYSKQRALLKQDEVSQQRREHGKKVQKERQAEKTAQIKQWRIDNPEAYRAQTAIGNALRDRKLIKSPCQMCGASENIHGHHRDYNRPLDVVWLCSRCHKRIHAIFPELGGHYDKRAA